MMPTLITKTLKKDGSGDYTTISAFCAGEAANLVSLDQVMRLEIYKAGWDKTTPLTENFVEIGNNFTTDATRYVEFYVADSDRHDFTEDTGFVMTLDNQYGFVFRSEFVTVDGIEFYNISCAQAQMWFEQDNALFKNCLLYDATSASGVAIENAENCIAYNYPSGNNDYRAMFKGSNSNCTAIIIAGASSFGGSIAMHTGVSNDSLVYKDLDITTQDAYFNCTGDYNGVNRAGEGVPGANSQTNLATSDFNDYANKDFRLNPTSAFVTNGSGGGFMGAAVAPGGSGVTVTALLNSNYMVEYSMKKNVASQSIGAQMVTIADGTDFTGTVTAEVTVDGGTKTAGGGTVTHEGDGYHSYAPTQAETNGDHIAVSFAGTGALSQTIQVYTTFPQSVDNAVGIGNIDTIVDLIKSDTTAILVDTDDLQTNQGNWLTATGFNTVVPPSVAQFNARSIPSADYFIVTDYTAPDNASIASILTDTNELQVNQGNWLTATGFATTAEIADVPTVAEFNARTLPSASYSQFDYTTNEVNANIAKINGVTITGDGAGSPFDV